MCVYCHVELTLAKSLTFIQTQQYGKATVITRYINTVFKQLLLNYLTMVEGREIPKLFTAIASLSLQSQENVSILANSQDKTAPVPPLVINNAITNKLP